MDYMENKKKIWIGDKRMVLKKIKNKMISRFSNVYKRINIDDVIGGNHVDECNDEEYKKQIIYSVYGDK